MIFVELYLWVAGAGLVLGGAASLLPSSAWRQGRELSTGFVILIAFILNGLIWLCSTL